MVDYKKTRLWFETQKDDEFGFTIQHYVVDEALSSPFEVIAHATTNSARLDLDKMVGHAAGLVVKTPHAGERVWAGICSEVELEHSGEQTAGGGTDLVASSRYRIVIRPALWRLTLRRNSRVFQHKSAPEIVEQILAEWDIKVYEPPKGEGAPKEGEKTVDHPGALSKSLYAKYEYRVQWDETDFDFVSRLLEDVGISYYLLPLEMIPEKATKGRNLTWLVLEDEPQKKEAIAWPAEPPAEGSVGRAAGELPYVGDDRRFQEDQYRFVMDVSILRRSRPARMTVRDYDYRTIGGFDRPNEASAHRPTPKDAPPPAGGGGAGAGGAGDGCFGVGGGAGGGSGGGATAQAPKPVEIIVKSGGTATDGPGTGHDAHAKMGTGKLEDHEQYRYLHGAFVTEHAGTDPSGLLGCPVHGGQETIVGYKQLAAENRARRMLEETMSDRSWVRFSTNALDLQPGTTFKIGHPKAPSGYSQNHPHPWLSYERKLLVVRMTLVGETHTYKISGLAVFADEPYRPMRKTPKPRIFGVQSALVVGPEGGEAHEIHTDGMGRVRVQFHWDREGHWQDSSCWMRVAQQWAGGGFGFKAIPRVGHEVLVGFYDGNPDQPVVVGSVYNATNPPAFHEHPHAPTQTGIKTDHSPHRGKALGFNELRFDDTVNDKGAPIGGIHIQADPNLDVVISNAGTTSAGASYTISVGGVGSSIVMTPTSIVLSTGGCSLTLSGGHISLESSGPMCLHAGALMHVQSTANINMDAAEVHICDGGPSAPAPAPAAPGSATAPSHVMPLPGEVKPQVNCVDRVLPGPMPGDIEVGPPAPPPDGAGGGIAGAAKSATGAMSEKSSELASGLAGLKSGALGLGGLGDLASAAKGALGNVIGNVANTLGVGALANALTNPMAALSNPMALVQACQSAAKLPDTLRSLASGGVLNQITTGASMLGLSMPDVMSSALSLNDKQAGIGGIIAKTVMGAPTDQMASVLASQVGSAQGCWGVGQPAQSAATGLPFGVVPFV